jgi:integrase
MAKSTPLTDTEIRKAKPTSKQYRLGDGKGLYLLVFPTGAKYWRLDYTINGTRKTYAIGIYPEVSLAKARKRKEKARELIAEGIDPVEHKRLVSVADRAAAQNTFESIALDWYARQEKSWKPGHARTVKSRLERNIFPWLGSASIKEIEAPKILSVLRRIEARGAGETAHRCNQIISQVFRYAIAAGLADRNPAADLRGALSPVRAQKMAALTDPHQVAALIRAMRGYEGDFITRIALQFSALSFARPGEIRHAEWSEINWIKKQWTIPADKMKMKQAHIVPLTTQALSLLRELYPLTGKGRYIFPSLRSRERPMSNNTILAALRRMGFAKEEMTAHGFRSTASTILHEHGFDHEAIERQLAHGRKDAVAAAYDRSQRLTERRAMMQWYADHLDELASGSDHDTSMTTIA